MQPPVLPRPRLNASGSGGQYFPFTGNHGVRQSGVAQRGGLVLAVRQHPFKKCDDGLFLIRARDAGGDQKIGESHDRIGVRVRGIGDRDAQVIGDVVGRHGLRDRHQIGLDEFAGGVADQSIAQPVPEGEDKFHVANGVGCPSDPLRHSFVKLSANAGGPIHRSPRTNHSPPVRTDLRQIVRPYVAGSTPVSAVHHHDFTVREPHAAVRGA